MPLIFVAFTVSDRLFHVKTIRNFKVCLTDLVALHGYIDLPSSSVCLYCNRSTSASLCAMVHYRLINYATYMRV